MLAKEVEGQAYAIPWGEMHKEMGGEVHRGMESWVQLHIVCGGYYHTTNPLGNAGVTFSDVNVAY